VKNPRIQKLTTITNVTNQKPQNICVDCIICGRAANGSGQEKNKSSSKRTTNCLERSKRKRRDKWRKLIENNIENKPEVAH